MEDSGCFLNISRNDVVPSCHWERNLGPLLCLKVQQSAVRLLIYQMPAFLSLRLEVRSTRDEKVRCVQAFRDMSLFLQFYTHTDPNPVSTNVEKIQLLG